MCQTKESNKRAPGRVVIYIQVNLVLIYNITCSNVLLVHALNFMVHKSNYCKCSLAWCQVRTFILFTIWTHHPLQVRQYPLRYAGTDRIKKNPTIIMVLEYNAWLHDRLFFKLIIVVQDHMVLEHNMGKSGPKSQKSACKHPAILISKKVQFPSRVISPWPRWRHQTIF